MKKIRRYRNQRGVTRALWRQPLIWLLVAVLIIGGTGIGFWAAGPAKPIKPTLAKASLSSSEKVFVSSQHPKLSLRLPKAHKSLADLLIPKVSADALPDVSIEYKGAPIELPTTIKATDDGYDITLAPDITQRPGKYDVTVTGDTADGQPFKQTTSFAWGVLAVNTDQAAYNPGQAVNLSMAVLDSKGHTKCRLVLDLQVTDPSGQVSKVPTEASKDCNGDSFVNAPDYTAVYTTTNAVGTYNVQFGLKDSPYHINDSFTVSNSSQYSIQRTGATRFNPNYEYGMHLHVTANQAFSGKVVETLPDPRFIIGDNGGAVVTNQGNKVILTWTVNWQAGHSYDLAYSYHPPRQSPSFFVIAPAQLVNNDNSIAYREGRGWSLAGDSAITYVKDTLADSGAPSAITLTKNLTSTAGNTLIFVGGVAANTDTGRYISSVTDSNSVTWTSTTRPASNPPSSANTGGTITSSFIVGYLRNSSAVTSVTANATAGANIAIGFDVSEWSGIDNTMSTFGAKTQGDGTTLASSITTASLDLNTCDVPTTDELLGQGEWFCKYSDSYLIITAAMAGNTAFGAPSTNGFTALPTVLINGTANRMGEGYLITSASGTYNTQFSLTPDKSGSTGTFAMGQDISGTNREQAMYK